MVIDGGIRIPSVPAPARAPGRSRDTVRAVLTSVSTLDPAKILFPVSETDYLAANKRAREILSKPLAERPETIECGSNILAGSDPDAIVRAVQLAISQPASWQAPAEYMAANVSQTVSKIVLGHHSPRHK